MNILDAQGRLFGRVSVLDLGAVLIVVLVIVGIFFAPGTTGSVAQVGVDTQPVEVDVMVRGLTVSEPEALRQALETEGSTSVVIRNQPYGQVDVLNVQETPRSVAVPQPDGSVIALPDPRPELAYTTDLLITLGGDAQITENGPVLGNSKLKIGIPVELEGDSYNFNASVVGVRVNEQ
ncbi:MAG: DUF4330 domain-containing protein [Cyanobacteria bacterium P01_H01_bin.121]